MESLKSVESSPLSLHVILSKSPWEKGLHRKFKATQATFLFYKPYGVVCRFSPQEGKITLGDLLKLPKDVYPVGRLDEDSEGLLLLSSDRRLNAALLHPRHRVAKTYLALVEGEPTEESLEQLRHGVTIKIKDKGWWTTSPCKAEVVAAPEWLPERVPPPAIRKGHSYSWLRLTLYEGKNRQVRKMTAAIGHPTLRLVRTGLGSLSLESMKPGELRQLNAAEVNALLRSFARS